MSHSPYCNSTWCISSVHFTASLGFKMARQCWCSLHCKFLFSLGICHFLLFQLNGKLFAGRLLDSWSVWQHFQAVVQWRLGAFGATFWNFLFYHWSAVLWVWVRKGCNSALLGSQMLCILCQSGETVCLWQLEGLSVVLVTSLFGNLQQMAPAFPSPPHSCCAYTDWHHLLNKLRLGGKCSLLLSEK